MKKGIFINITLSLLSLFSFLFLLEMGLRFFSIDTPTVEVSSKQWSRLDPTFGAINIPNRKYRYNIGKYSVSYEFNSKGIRGPEYSYLKPDGEYRILILGDSFAMGFGVTFEDLFSEVLKKKLNSRGVHGRSFQIINTGVGGWCTGMELIFLDKKGKNYKPDLTVVMFYQNDILCNNQPEYYPIFNLSSLLPDTPIPKSPKGQSWIERYRAKTPVEKPHFLKKLKKWFAENSYLYRFIVRRVKNERHLFYLAQKLHILDKDNLFFDDEVQVWRRSYDGQTIAAWKMTEAIILKMKEETESIGSKLLIFYVPSLVSIYSNAWNDTKKKYGISDREWDVNKPGIELGNICKKNNIDFINPTDKFIKRAEELKAEGKSLYYLQEGHWDADGHKLAAELLAQYIPVKYLSRE